MSNRNRQLYQNMQLLVFLQVSKIQDSKKAKLCQKDFFNFEVRIM